MSKTKLNHNHPYSVHPGVAMVQTWIAKLPEKTGRSLTDWLTFIQTAGPATEKERRDWLKQAHGLGTNTAGWLAERADGKGTEEDTPEAYLQAALQYVEAQYAGKKAHLRPIYEALLELGLGLGEEVKVCPGKTIVPLYRNHVFAQIKAPNQAWVELGFAMKGIKATGRLIETGGAEKGDRITHRLPIPSLEEIDNEVRHWLRMAYELDQ